LQFSRSTWKAYGGAKYAGTADKASRSEQIAVAERVLDGQGIGAWPTCGKKAGSTATTAKKATPKKSAKAKSTTKARTTTKAKSTKARTTTKATSTSTTRPTGTVRADGRHHVVRSGDTLSSIATRYTVAGGWQTVYQLNKAQVGANPNLIRPGQRLAL
jgi:nucleoid-associated protein YgaU